MWPERALRRQARRLRPLAGIRHTTTFRLTATLGVVFLLAIVGLLGLVYRLTEHELTARTDLLLIHAAQPLRRVPPEQLPVAVEVALAASTSGYTYMELLDANGRIVTGNLDLRHLRLTNKPYDAGPGDGAPVPMRVLAWRSPGGHIMVVGRDSTPTAYLRDRILLILLGGGAACIVLTAAASVALSLGPLRRIGRLQQVAGRIAAGELGLRMPLTGLHDEMDIISTAINTMVEEIERLMVQVKGATDAIAHDLRTPLTHLRGRLDRLKAQGHPADGPEQEWAPLVDGAIEELEAVLARFNALLRISELEARHRRAGFAPLSPLELLGAVAELYEPLAEERDLTLAIEGSVGLVVEGDETLLFEAVSNLVDNAIKFTAPGGAIRLIARAEQGNVLIEVRDNGPGIAPRERELVLRRFARGAAGRQAPGSGLGLSLVAAIAHLHGFGLELEEASPGLVVRLRAPRG